MAKDCLLNCPTIEHALNVATQTEHDAPYVQTEAWNKVNLMVGKLPQGCPGPREVETPVEVPLAFHRLRRVFGMQTVRETTTIEFVCPKLLH